MSSNGRRLIHASLAAALAASAGCARSVNWASPSVCHDAPPPLAAPAGNELAFELFAEGVQIYRCVDSAAGVPVGNADWVLQAPDATLVDHNGVRAGKHGAGPAWEALDGSRVVASKVESTTPDRLAVPWLLLRAKSHEGPEGSMSAVTFVQRLATSGGNAPPDGCSRDTVGGIVRVPYRATYCFYRAREANAYRQPTPQFAARASLGR
jgi:hypothetical protein